MPTSRTPGRTPGPRLRRATTARPTRPGGGPGGVRRRPGAAPRRCFARPAGRRGSWCRRRGARRGRGRRGRARPRQDQRHGDRAAHRPRRAAGAAGVHRPRDAWPPGAPTPDRCRSPRRWRRGRRSRRAPRRWCVDVAGPDDVRRRGRACSTAWPAAGRSRGTRPSGRVGAGCEAGDGGRPAARRNRHADASSRCYPCHRPIGRRCRDGGGPGPTSGGSLPPAPTAAHQVVGSGPHQTVRDTWSQVSPTRCDPRASARRAGALVV